MEKIELDYMFEVCLIIVHVQLYMMYNCTSCNITANFKN